MLRCLKGTQEKVPWFVYWENIVRDLKVDVTVLHGLSLCCSYIKASL